MTTTWTELVPGDWATVPQGKRASHYGTPAANVALLEEACLALSLGRRQLGRLLGMRTESNIFAWFSGRRRPSAMYLSRLSWLLILGHGPNKLYTAKRIDWGKGLCLWENGSVTKLGALSPGLAPGPDPRLGIIPRTLSQIPNQPKGQFFSRYGGKPDKDGYPYGKTGPVY